MANIAALNILTAIREVIEDGEGSVRTIASSRFQGGLYTGLPRDDATMRALSAPAVETEITAVRPHPAGFVVNCNMGLYELDVEIRLVRRVELKEKLDDDLRDAAKALAIVDGGMLQQALQWPGNLTQTSAAAATGLVSGLLIWDGSDATVEMDGETAPRIVTTHNFRGTANVTLATS